jgi:cephalosporin-C deacetylase
MAEADQIPLDYTISPSEIPCFDTCDYLDLWFTGMEGARLYAKYLRPRAEKPVPLVLQFHGYPGSSRSWLEQSSYAGMGCALLAMDCPGQGGRGQDVGGYLGTTVTGHIVAGLDGPPEKLYYVRMHQNIRILCRIVRELSGIDLGKVFINGASQGGGLGLACAALNPELIDRAAILYPFLSDYRMVWELGADQIAYEGIRYYARWFDPAGERLEEWFGKLGYIDSKNFAHLIRCPVLFGTGLADTICPPETQCAVYNNLTCPKKRYFFPGFGHEEIQDFDDLILDFFGREEAAL